MTTKTSKLPGSVRRALYILSAGAWLLATAGPARAQASLSFSGGNNTPFVLTLNGPVQYVINAALTSNAPFFVFKNVGNPLGGQRPVSGTIQFSINFGPSQTITTANSGAAVGTIGSNDLFFFGPFSSLVIGDTIRLTAGTITTTTNVAGAPPAGGFFTTYLTDSNGVQVSTTGMPVPEPTTWGLLGLGGLMALGCGGRAARVARVHSRPPQGG